MAARGVAEAEMRQTGVESIAETSAERESRRDETQRESASRDESRAPPTETKGDETRLKRETQSEKETTSNDSLKLELVRRALLYI